MIGIEPIDLCVEDIVCTTVAPPRDPNIFFHTAKEDIDLDVSTKNENPKRFELLSPGRFIFLYSLNYFDSRYTNLDLYFYRLK